MSGEKTSRLVGHYFITFYFQIFFWGGGGGFAGGVAMVLQHRYFIQETLSTGTISSGVSHSDGSCVLGRIHSDVSSNIPKKVYHIVTDNFVNLLHISYAWLYKTECWGRKFHAFSFNSHRNCKIFMTNFNFIFDTICVPYIFRKSIFGWNCDHDTPLCDTPLLEDTPLCDTPDDMQSWIWIWYICLNYGFQKIICLKPTTPEGRDTSKNWICSYKQLYWIDVLVLPYTGTIFDWCVGQWI